MSNARNLAKVAVDANGDIGTASLDNIDLTTRVAKAGDTMTGQLIVNNTGTFRGIETNGSSLGFGASKWMIQQEGPNDTRAYYCGADPSSYQNWEIYRATSTGSPLLTMRMDSAGRVTMPYQPAFHCSYTNGAANVNNTIVIFPQADVNRGGHYNTSTGKFTAPVAGVYHFWCALMVNSSGAAPDFRWHKNGVNTGVAGYVSGSFGGGSWLKAHGSISIYLNANDTIEVHTVSNVNMHIDGVTNNHNQLGGFLLG